MTTADITLKTAEREVSHADWDWADRERLETRAAATAACKARMAAADAISATLEHPASSAWGDIVRHPTVAPLQQAEEAAMRTEAAVTRALIGTPAPNWRAWAIKAQVVREYLDDVLDPLAPYDRKLSRKRPKSFAGTRRFMEAHHYAAAMAAGIGTAELAALIPPLVMRMCAELEIVPDAHSDAKIREYGLAMIAADAARLVSEGEA